MGRTQFWTFDYSGWSTFAYYQNDASHALLSRNKKLISTSTRGTIYSPHKPVELCDVLCTCMERSLHKNVQEYASMMQVLEVSQMTYPEPSSIKMLHLATYTPSVLYSGMVITNDYGYIGYNQ